MGDPAVNRRQFLQISAGAAISAGPATLWPTSVRGDPAGADPLAEAAWPPPAYSVIPVVGDGKWIWNKPPDSAGYLEPRLFDVTVGIELQGRGNATQIMATTPVPVECPEQKIEEQRIETTGCTAEVRSVGPFARQLFLSAPQIVPGQTISAKAHYKLTLYKQFQNYHREQFPQRQLPPAAVRKQYLGESPGIQTRAPEVRQLLSQLSSEKDHPWDLVKKIADWIPRNIRPQIGPFTGVIQALQTRLGDCAEMSAIFVALCRAAEIPARLVWVPNHNWAEFCLLDQQGKESWIPVHTACYFWFGWTGAHELVIQKGDRLRVPEKPRFYRLLEDWMQWSGRRPEVRYLAELTPLAEKPGDDPGPGARRKSATGQWLLAGTHPMDRYMRR
jgi:hypothetical protein